MPKYLLKTICAVLCYGYSIIYIKHPTLIIKAPTLVICLFGMILHLGRPPAALLKACREQFAVFRTLGYGFGFFGLWDQDCSSKYAAET